MSDYRISTHYDPKPIPQRGFDWCATDDATYSGDEGDPIGWGATEAAAIAELKEQLEERAAAEREAKRDAAEYAHFRHSMMLQDQANGN